jgi:D-glycero-alpha-D-manno-heptose-7-phosphate kinase
MAIELEQKVIGENVGSQDQVACTFGGINKIIFTNKDSWEVRPLNLSLNRINEIEERCFLTYTGIDRISSDISKGLLENLSKSEKVLKKTMDLVDVAENLISGNTDLDILGDLLREATKLKFEANPSAQTPSILNFISQGIKSGALGGKILGAGGGGFCLFWLKKGDKQRFKSSFKLGKEVPFKIDFSGASIIASQPWKGF